MTHARLLLAAILSSALCFLIGWHVGYVLQRAAFRSATVAGVRDAEPEGV